MIRIGFHLSIAGSVANAAREAIYKNYSAFQIFTTSSRSWRNSIIDGKEMESFKDITGGKRGPMPYAHIPYLCNPATSNADIRKKSIEMLVNNLNNCRSLGIGNLVIHLGSHLGNGMDAGIENVANAVSHALGKTERVKVLLENGAGYSNCVGSRFQEIAEIMEKIGSERVGVCLDTCHAFAAGYDISDDESIDRLTNEIESTVGISNIGLIHLNDAKHSLGSGLDRHWHIGKGYIGKRGFSSLFRNSAFRKGSFIMELPEDGTASHADDMDEAMRIMESSRP